MLLLEVKSKADRADGRKSSLATILQQRITTIDWIIRKHSGYSRFINRIIVFVGNDIKLNELQRHLEAVR